MIQVTLSQYNKIPKDYRGTITRDDWPELKGKRTAFQNCLLGASGLPLVSLGGTHLCIEGLSFEIVTEAK